MDYICNKLYVYTEKRLIKILAINMINSYYIATTILLLILQCNYTIIDNSTFLMVTYLRYQRYLRLRFSIFSNLYKLYFITIA